MNSDLQSVCGLACHKLVLDVPTLVHVVRLIFDCPVSRPYDHCGELKTPGTLTP